MTNYELLVAYQFHTGLCIQMDFASPTSRHPESGREYRERSMQAAAGITGTRVTGVPTRNSVLLDFVDFSVGAQVALPV